MDLFYSISTILLMYLVTLSVSIGNDEKYLLYQPQFGLCNQLRSLHHAIAISRSLGRTLVIPDFIDDNGKGSIYKRDILYDNEGLLQVLNGKAISMSNYRMLAVNDRGMIPRVIVKLNLNLKQLKESDRYYQNLGWSNIAQISAAGLAGYKEIDWCEWDKRDTENVRNDKVLALSSTFGAWMGASRKEDRTWHGDIEQYVYQEAKWISAQVEKIIMDQKNKLQNGFMCVHVRRGDFFEACARYSVESQSGTARPWVTNFDDSNLACWVDDKIFLEQVAYVNGLVSRNRLPVFISSNDMVCTFSVCLSHY